MIDPDVQFRNLEQLAEMWNIPLQVCLRDCFALLTCLFHQCALCVCARACVYVFVNTHSSSNRYPRWWRIVCVDLYVS